MRTQPDEELLCEFEYTRLDWFGTMTVGSVFTLLGLGLVAESILDRNVISFVEAVVCGPIGFYLLYRDGRDWDRIGTIRYRVRATPRGVSLYVEGEESWFPYNELKRISARSDGLRCYGQDEYSPIWCLTPRRGYKPLTRYIAYYFDGPVELWNKPVKRPEHPTPGYFTNNWRRRWSLWRAARRAAHKVA